MMEHEVHESEAQALTEAAHADDLQEAGAVAQSMELETPQAAADEIALPKTAQNPPGARRTTVKSGT